MVPCWCPVGALLVTSVVQSSYVVEVNNEHVILGNSALLKCTIPSFVTDFVAVASWIVTDTQSNAINLDYHSSGTPPSSPSTSLYLPLPPSTSLYLPSPSSTLIDHFRHLVTAATGGILSVGRCGDDLGKSWNWATILGNGILFSQASF